MLTNFCIIDPMLFFLYWFYDCIIVAQRVDELIEPDGMSSAKISQRATLPQVLFQNYVSYLKQNFITNYKILLLLSFIYFALMVKFDNNLRSLIQVAMEF